MCPHHYWRNHSNRAKMFYWSGLTYPRTFCICIYLHRDDDMSATVHAFVDYLYYRPCSCLHEQKAHAHKVGRVDEQRCYSWHSWAIQMIRSTLNRSFHRFRLIHHAHQLLRCLARCRSGDFCLCNRQQMTDKTKCFTPLALAYAYGVISFRP